MALEEIRRRCQAVRTVRDVVSAMRAIAAGRIQGSQRALAAARRYEAVVRRGIDTLAAESPARPVPAVKGRAPMLVVFTSEQPLCGAFNQDVLSLAERRWVELRRAGLRPYLVVVGQRGTRQMVRRGITPDAGGPAATSLPALRDVLRQLARMIDGRYAAREAGALHVVYNRYRSISEQVPTEEQVLPLTVQGPSRRHADNYCRYLPVRTLLAGLIGEYVFISLYRMAAESYASEQASRLVTMDGATRNAERLLNTMLDLERRERQGQVTRQTLELVGSRFAFG